MVVEILLPIVGLVLGVVIGYFLSSRLNSVGKMRSELTTAKRQLKMYQEDTTKHLEKTHGYITSLYDQICDLQTHAMDGAEQLNPDVSRQTLLQPKTYPKDKIETQSPPKDYV